MTYSETLEFMFNSLPMYHRIGKAAYKADITNTAQLMEHLGNPEMGFRSIHVAGTNGKGSVSHFLASILHKAGLKVGLYTSPHLADFRERIRIDGEMIPEAEVVRFVEANHQFLVDLQLSFFEMTVGLAFDHFRNQKVDVAIIEVGMGGRLDSTNVIQPDLSIITNISFDHTGFLGDTLAKIAGEKAGIIKHATPVVIGETHPETRPVFEAKAKEMEAPIIFADQHYTIQSTDPEAIAGFHFDVLHEGETVRQGLFSPMGGWYQLHNIATLMQVLEMLPNLGYKIEECHIKEGIRDVVCDTGLHGRWELLASNPTTICETAHNEAGITSMLGKLQSMNYGRLHIVYGCVNDKDYRSILRMMPHDAHYYVTRPNVPRGLDAATLHQAVLDEGISADLYPTCQEAIIAARKSAGKDDLVLITGSIFLVADAVACKIS